MTADESSELAQPMGWRARRVATLRRRARRPLRAAARGRLRAPRTPGRPLSETSARAAPGC
eukprot:3137562-Prymnesium_polylepis.1